MLIELCDYDAGRRQQKKRILTLNCWLAFLLRPLLAAGLALAYIRSGIVLSPIVAVNIGVAAPLILKAMLRAGPGR